MLLFGSLIAAVDPVAVLAVFEEIKVRMTITTSFTTCNTKDIRTFISLYIKVEKVDPVAFLSALKKRLFIISHQIMNDGVAVRIIEQLYLVLNIYISRNSR